MYNLMDNGYIDVTTKKEINYWCLYDWANSPISSPILAMIVPLLIERLSTQNVCESVQCNSDGDPIDGSEKYLNGLGITPNTFAFFIIGISVFLQAVSFISFCSYADYENHRKKMFKYTALLGSITTMLFLFCTNDSLWWLVGVLTIFVNIFFGLSIVFYNAYLPLMVHSHEDYIKAKRDDPQSGQAEEDRIINEISTKGITIGYFGGLIVTFIVFVVIYFYPHADSNYDNIETNWSLVISIFIAGVWWFIFTLVSYSQMKDRSGPKYESTDNIIIFSWKRTISTIKDLKNHYQMKKYIISYFLFSDAYSTIGGVGILYAKTELNVSENILAIIVIEVTIFAIIGNILFLYIQKKFNISSKTILIIQLYILMFLCLFGFIILDGKTHLILTFGAIYGLLIGTSQSYSRSLFTQLIPMGYESQYFSLYEISDKSSSSIGPLIMAVISQYTSLRYGFIYIIFVTCLSIPILKSVNFEKKETPQEQGSDQDLIFDPMDI